MRNHIIYILAFLLGASAAHAGDPPRANDKPTCSAGFTGPIKVFATGYVSWKAGEERCDKWGGPDQPGAGGTSRPSAQRYQGNPKDGWVMVAIPKDASYYKREMVVVGGTLGRQPFNRLNGVIFQAQDRIGRPDPKRTDSVIGQVDISMTCPALAEWHRQDNPYLYVCVKAAGGTTNAAQIQRKPGAAASPAQGQRKRTRRST